jgi:hypothetical protein
VDDWEQSFIDKSRRRFEAERRHLRNQRIRAWTAAAVVGLLVVAAIVELAIQQ